ncbi:MAG TPA: SCP2 sterol-binding domain-containing protein [Gammaproteobacteria bacterium]|nr:SCP2 sterol-binding domain-containing protein [Gammaproteobacteria bacterium]
MTDAEAQYSLHIADGDMSVQSGLDEADITLLMNEHAWREMLLQCTGSPTELFMAGRLRTKGGMGLAMRLQGVLAPALAG